jgi:hypothetical protein
MQEEFEDLFRAALSPCTCLSPLVWGNCLHDRLASTYRPGRVTVSNQAAASRFLQHLDHTPYWSGHRLLCGHNPNDLGQMLWGDLKHRIYCGYPLALCVVGLVVTTVLA